MINLNHTIFHLNTQGLFYLIVDKELCDASSEGSVERIQSALARGANIECKFGTVSTNGFGYGDTSPLIAASCRGHCMAVELLLANGSDVNRLDSSGYSALHLSCPGGHDEVISILLDNGAEIDLVADSACTKKYTALHFASRYGRSSSVRLLLQRGASSSVGKEGKTPLEMARTSRNSGRTEEFKRVFQEFGITQ